MEYLKVSMIAFTVFFSCSVSSSQTIERKEKGTVIDLDNIRVNTEEEFLYSSMYKSIKTIILETNESSIIGFMNKMRVYDPYIIVLDTYVAKSLLIFDMNGRFIRKIGSIGQGPGEYRDPDDFTVDKEGNVIYVLDSHSYRIHKYDLTTGKFIHSIILDKNVLSHNIEYVGGTLFADAYFNQHSANNYLLRTIQDPSGKMGGHFLNVNEYGKGVSNISFVHKNVFYLRENGNVVFAQPFMDKIIEISKDSVFSLFDIKGKDVLTSETIKTAMEQDAKNYMLNIFQYNKYFHIQDFVEHGNMIQFNYRKGIRLNMILYNKHTSEVSITQKRWDDLFYINKDIDGLYFPTNGGYDTHGVYYYYDTRFVSKLQQLADNAALSPELDKLEDLKNLEEDANPVIFYYEFKD